MTKDFKLFKNAKEKKVAPGPNKKPAKKKPDPSTQPGWMRPQIYEFKNSKNDKIYKAEVPEKDKGYTFDDLLTAVEMVENKYNLPENLVLSIISIESGGNPTLVSQSKSLGFAQLQDIFRKEYNIKDPFHVPSVVDAIGAELKHGYGLAINSPNAGRYKDFGWDPHWELATMMYSGGRTGTLDWLKKGASREKPEPLKPENIEYPYKVSSLMRGGIQLEIPTMQKNWENALLFKKP